MFFAGIDAHTRYCVLVIVDKQGVKQLGPVRVPVGSAQKLVELVAPFRPLEAVVETGPTWPWLYEVLDQAGVQFVLAYAKKLRAIAEANYKRDQIDAELLARMRIAGLIPEVYPTPAYQREWARLVRHRWALSVQRTMLLNRVHAQLHQVGLSMGRGQLLTRKGKQWVRACAWPQLGTEQRCLIRTHFQLVARLSVLLRALDRRIAYVAGGIREAQLLKTIPGVGDYRALLLCAELLPIVRFARPDHVVSYAGLAPRTSQSGQRPIRHGSIPRAVNRWLRGALVRAVVSHVQHAPESWLTKYYEEQKQRVGWQVARIAAARKLARAVHAMLRTQRAWSMQQPGLGRAPLNSCRTDG